MKKLIFYILINIFVFPAIANGEDIGKIFITERTPSLNKFAQREYIIDFSKVNGFGIVAERVGLTFDPCEKGKAAIMQDGLKIGAISFNPGRVSIEFQLKSNVSKNSEIEIVENIDREGPIKSVKSIFGNKHAGVALRFAERAPALDIEFISKNEIALLYADESVSNSFASLLNPQIQEYKNTQRIEKEIYFAKSPWARNGEYLFGMTKEIFSHLVLKLNEFADDWGEAQNKGTEMGFLIATSKDLAQSMLIGTVDLGKNFYSCSVNMVKEAQNGNWDAASKSALGAEISWLFLGMTAKGAVKMYKPTTQFIDTVAQNTWITLKNGSRIMSNPSRMMGIGTPKGNIFAIPAVIELDALIPLPAGAGSFAGGAAMMASANAGAKGMGGGGPFRILPETVEEGSIIRYYLKDLNDEWVEQWGIYKGESAGMIHMEWQGVQLNIAKGALKPGRTRVMMEPLKPGKIHYIYRSDGTIMEAPILRIEERLIGNQRVIDKIVFNLGNDDLGYPITKAFYLDDLMNINIKYIQTFESAYWEMTVDMAKVGLLDSNTSITTPFRGKVWEISWAAAKARDAAEQSVFDLPFIRPMARRNYLDRLAEKQATRALARQKETLALEAEEAARAARASAERAKQAARNAEKGPAATVSDIDITFNQYRSNPTFMHHYRTAYERYASQFDPDAQIMIGPGGRNELAHIKAVTEALEKIQ